MQLRPGMCIWCDGAAVLTMITRGCWLPGASLVASVTLYGLPFEPGPQGFTVIWDMIGIRYGV